MQTKRKPSFTLQLRRVHMYLGTAFTPLLIFFAITGSWMLFELHAPPQNGRGFQPPAWVVGLSQIHKSQGTMYPSPGEKSPPSPLLFRLFVLIAAIGLINNSLTGIFMAFKFIRNKRLVLLIIVAGCVLPVLLFWLL